MTRDTREAPPLWSQPPLPGTSSCLTVQLNATYYYSQASCRWVCILRDPDANVELARLIGATRPDDGEAMDALFHDLGQVLGLVDWQFHGTLNEMKEELAASVPPPVTPPNRSKRRTTSA